MKQRLRETWKGLGRPGRWAILACCVYLAWVLAGFLLVPPLVRLGLESGLRGALNREVRAGRIRFNPFTLALGVEGLRVSEPDGSADFLSCERLLLDLDASSLPTLTLRAAEFRVEGPFARLVFTGNGAANFSDLLAGEAGGEGESGGLPVVLRSFAVKNGRFVIEDRVLGKQHEVRDFALDIPFASSLPEDSAAYVEPTLSAEVNGRPVRLRGRTMPFAPSRRTEFDFSVSEVGLAEYWAYAPVPAGLALTSGRLSCNASVVLEQTGELLPSLFVRGRFQVRDAALAGPGGRRLAAFDTLDLDLDRFSLLERVLDLSRVELAAPRLDLVRLEDGALDLAGLLPAAGEGEGITPGPPFVVHCAELAVRGGRVRFTDQSAPNGFAADLEDLSLHATNASSGPGSAAFTLAARGIANLDVQGRFSLDPPGVDAGLSLSGLSLPALAPYLGHALPARVQSGAAAIRGRVAAGPRGLVLSGLDLELSGPALALPGAAAPFLTLDSLAVQAADVDFAARKASARTLRLAGGRLLAVRGANGRVDLAGLAPAGNDDQLPAGGGGPAWDVRLDQAEVAGMAVEFRDLAAGPGAVLAVPRLDVTLENPGLDLARPLPARIAAEFRPGGRLAFVGSVVPATPALRGRLDLSGLALSLASPWLPAGAPLRPAGGTLSLDGDLALEAGPALAAIFAGDVQVNGLSLDDRSGRIAATLDVLNLDGVRLAAPEGRVQATHAEAEEFNLPGRDTDRPVLSLGRLRAEDLALDLAARSCTVRSLTLAAPAAWLALGADGLNLARTIESLAPDQAPDVAGEPAAPEGEVGPFTVGVDSLRVFGGALDFRDATLSPAATLRLSRLGGAGRDLSTAAGRRGVLALNATVERHAPLFLEGGLARDQAGLRADVRLSLKGLDMAPLSPYLVKYTAYPADTGKLDADLDLAVSGDVLEGGNRILVRGLELGPRVEAVKNPAVPIQLAMSLLADSSGNLSLDIPIHGRLDDPQFDLGKVIASAMAGMVGKLVTAPFAFLGSIFSLVAERSLQGGVVAFAPGSADLGSEACEALSTVARALAERPRLEITAAGVAAPGADAPALKEALFLAKLKERKFRDLKRRRSGPARPGDVRIEPGEYQRWLTEAYEAEPMDKPRNFLGLVKDQPVPVMEEMLRATVRVGDRELLDLAADRAAAVRDYLLAAGRVAGERVFVRAPALEPEGAGQVRLGLR